MLYPVELRAHNAVMLQARRSGRNAVLRAHVPEVVGVEGFEPPTPCSQSRCATRLRYTPYCIIQHMRSAEAGDSTDRLASRQSFFAKLRTLRPDHPCLRGLSRHRLALLRARRAMMPRRALTGNTNAESAFLDSVQKDRGPDGKPSGPRLVWRARRDSNSRPPGS